jgi:AcrR family transcriptional regulator
MGMYTNRKTEAVNLSITIEHDKRKREILEKALDVFVDEGYEDTTFQKIAERCGITRTILYLYFKNKREIFSFSMKLFTEKLETEVKAIGADPLRNQSDKLAAILAMVVETCAAHRRLLTVILDYLGHIRAAGGDPDERVRRRTIRMRHILAGILIEGQKKGDFPAFSVKLAGDLIFAIIEATIFRIAVLGRENVSGLAEASSLLASSLKGASHPVTPHAGGEIKPRGRPAREGKAAS